MHLPVAFAEVVVGIVKCFRVRTFFHHCAAPASVATTLNIWRSVIGSSAVMLTHFDDRAVPQMQILAGVPSLEPVAIYEKAAPAEVNTWIS